MSSKPKVVVLGAGYAGMMTTKKLMKNLSPEEAEIILVNKHNYHYQTTWLHELAAGTINPNQVRIMISDIISPNRVRLIYDTVVEIDQENQKVILENSELIYDYLVISLGYESNTFGIQGMDEHAFFIENFESSQLIREHIEYQFAKYHNDPNAEESSLAILVGGGGFTGIEFIGELVEKIPKLCKKYDIDRGKVKIINVEAAPTILPVFDKDLVAYAKKSLQERGAEIIEGTKINECTEEGFIVGENNELIKAGTIVWTGGVKGSSVVEKSGFEITKGRVTVNGDLRVPGFENLFIIGDCAWVMNKVEERPYPPTAQAAMQHASTCANNIRALIRNEPLEEFVFSDKGTVASLGVTDAIGSILNGTKLVGKSAATMKKVVDDRYLLLLGGPKLLLKKGKFRPF
ncbi:NAD(P)/FAD-dependent oxidoreductase [Ornithinibacillus sp. 179-J 7C1 HS]|uniref:NAD(P)/FAD-dependent oxidoreductase n=1 Tax=Ornithinibacillus sp. 179-J 7C1 HS TaxID=3142384 RepID=UPI00399EF836